MSYQETIVPNERIEINSDIMGGKPVIRGTRVPVELVLRKLGAGMAPEANLADHPRLTLDDIHAAQAFAADYLADEITFKPRLASNTRPCFAASAISPSRSASLTASSFFRIFRRKIWRPAGVIFDEFNRNLSRVATVMNEFDGFSGHRLFRRIEKKPLCCSGLERDDSSNRHPVLFFVGA
ncbi:DUF433 domain-containing protein [Bradyrhizobium sp.]|uniref:DUF433 domain-containing protein n=1 Tax=Bradyrhizobium sp. TaxID=376 RepID=UPI003BB12417